MEDAGERLQRAYTRHAAGEADARFVEAAVAAFPLILAALRKTGGRVDEGAAWSAVVDAVLKIAEGHSRYDPARRRLVGFLTMVAARKLSNARRDAAVRRRHETHPENLPVADAEPAGYELVEQREWDAAKLEEAARLLGARDAAFLRAVADGAGRDAVAALLLGGPAADQAERDEVLKQARDRIRVRLKRAKMIE